MLVWGCLQSCEGSGHMHFAGYGVLRSSPVRCHPSSQGTYATLMSVAAVNLGGRLVHASAEAFCCLCQGLDVCLLPEVAASFFMWVSLFIIVVPLRREERTACFAPLFFLFFSFLFNMWMCTCDVRMSAHRFPHFPFPPFYLCPHFSKPFPRKKNRVQIACCILFWCVCVCVCVSFCHSWCFIACCCVLSLMTLSTVACWQLTMFIDARHPPPPFFFLPAFFCVYPRKNGSYLIRCKFLHSSSLYEHF